MHISVRSSLVQTQTSVVGGPDGPLVRGLFRRCDTSVITSGQAALRCDHTQRYAGEPAGPSARPDRRKLLIIVSIYFSRLVETITAPAQ